MTADTIAAVAGVLLSLGMSYIPGLSTWYDALDTIRKRLVMAGLMLVVAVAVVALSCAQVYTWVTCDQAGVVGVVEAFLAALVANQAAYLLTHKPAPAQG